VTQLRKAMLEELQRRNLSPITTRMPSGNGENGSAAPESL
jgi:hypothetical protein